MFSTSHCLWCSAVLSIKCLRVDCFLHVLLGSHWTSKWSASQGCPGFELWIFPCALFPGQTGGAGSAVPWQLRLRNSQRHPGWILHPSSLWFDSWRSSTCSDLRQSGCSIYSPATGSLNTTQTSFTTTSLPSPATCWEASVTDPAGTRQIISLRNLDLDHADWSSQQWGDDLEDGRFERRGHCLEWPEWSHGKWMMKVRPVSRE